jgi:hypothetical protein
LDLKRLDLVPTSGTLMRLPRKLSAEILPPADESERKPRLRHILKSIAKDRFGTAALSGRF